MNSKRHREIYAARREAGIRQRLQALREEIKATPPYMPKRWELLLQVDRLNTSLMALRRQRVGYKIVAPY